MSQAAVFKACQIWGAFEDGAMTFDYKMRPGVVPRSNALALMRLVGIEV